MKLEYNIVGVARKSDEDLKIIYDRMAAGVFGIGLAVTKSKKLAREIAVETFRRVIRFAGTFDTDMSGEYWIADICVQLARNSLRDPAVSESNLTKEQLDNVSSLLYDTVGGLDGDRGLMIIIRSSGDLSNADIARLTGYYSGAAGPEIRRGLAKLAAMDGSRVKKELPASIFADLKKACPDYYSQIVSDEQTQLAHVSHEAIYLSRETGSFSGDGREEGIVAGREADRRKRSGNLRRKVIPAVLMAVALAGIVAAVIAGSVNAKKAGEIVTPVPVAQYGNTIDMVKIGDDLFFRGVSGGIYRYDTSGTGAPVMICDANARELITDGNVLIFRGDRSRLFSVDPDGSGLKQLCDRPGTTLAYGGELVYFSSSDGIYAMPPGGVSDDSELVTVYQEEVEDAPSRNHIVVTENGEVLFSGGADKGIFLVNDREGIGGLTPLYFDEVYYMTIWDGLLLFDSMNSGRIEMNLMDVGRRKAAVVGLSYDTDGDGNIIYESGSGSPALSYSAAYCVFGDRLWYEGYKDAGAGIRSDIGIYVIGKYSGSPELVLPMDGDGLHVTEMFTDGNRLYCFFSDGRADGERRLVSYDLNDPGDERIIFEAKR